MPKDFDSCVKNGGKVITKSINAKQYIHVCFDAKGKSHSGDVKTKKGSNGSYPSMHENTKAFGRVKEVESGIASYNKS